MSEIDYITDDIRDEIYGAHVDTKGGIGGGDDVGDRVMSLRTVRYIGGDGSEVSLVASGRAKSFIELLREKRKLDPSYHHYIKGIYIPNLLLEVMRESGATTLIDRIKLPKELHCPTRLYRFMIKLNKTKPAPRPPAHEPISCFVDEKFYEKLDKVEEMCVNVENYYADAYNYIIDSVKNPELTLVAGDNKHRERNDHNNTNGRRRASSTSKKPARTRSKSQKKKK